MKCAIDVARRRDVLDELRKNEEFINGTILTEDSGAFKTHLEIIAAESSYLRKTIEAARDTPFENILISSASKDVVKNIIDFMYSGKIVLTLTNVYDTVKTAKLLDLPSVIEFCKQFLIFSMNKETCLDIYFFAKRFGHMELMESARSYFENHFQEIFPVSNDYLNLSFNDLFSILGSDVLNTADEEYVFWSVMRWIEKEPNGRVEYLPSLLRCIRFGLIGNQFFERNIRSSPYVSGNDDAQSIILQALQIYEDMPNSGNSFNYLNYRHPFLRPRVPNEFIFVMGGWSAGSATSIVETFDIKCKRWFLSLYSDNKPRAYHGMVWHKGYVYVIGGFDGSQCFNSVRRFDPVKHVWEEKSCLHMQRCYVSVATSGDYIYAIGGYDGHRRTRTCEQYDPSSNQWTLVGSMNQVRSDACADTLDGKVYIVGGFNGHQVLHSAEFYDPATDIWTYIAGMNSPRSGVRLVAYHGYLYAIGGFDGHNRLQTVEKYDPRARIWMMNVSSMLGPRSNFAVTVLCDRIYVLGGFNGLATISLAEYYDQQRNMWIAVPDLNLNRSALAACTLHGIPNVRDFTFLGNV